MASKIESVRCGSGSRVAPRMIDAARRMLMAAALFAVVAPASAVDPLPPELETAPLKQQAEWRARMGRESMAERQQVAERRHEQRLALKKTIVAGIHSEAADRRMAVLSPVPAPLPVVESGIATPGEIRWAVIVVVLLAAGFVVSRWLQNSRTARS